jgi:hypothetical protein
VWSYNEEVPADLRPVFERSSFVLAGHVRVGKARTAVFVSWSPLELSLLSGVLTAAFARRACPPTQARAWKGARVVALDALAEAGADHATQRIVELAVAADQVPPLPEAVPTALTFAGGGVSRYISFQEEFDTEYLASHRDPLFDPHYP